MALRCLLISLVASMGFDLPSPQDVTSWKVHGRDWLSARAVAVSSLGAEAAGWLGVNDPAISTTATFVAAAPEPPAATVAGDPNEATHCLDRAFGAVGDEMAAALTADHQRWVEAHPAPVAPEAPSIEAPALEVATSMLRAERQGAEVTGDDLAFPAPDAALIADPLVDVVEADAAPPGRLASAVRLTRDAVHAWASLVHAVGGEILVR